MRVLVVANGDPGSGPPPGPFDHIVAADGGARLCRAVALQPDLVVGDMDSLPATDRTSLAATGSRFQVHPDPVNKEETDLELAVEAALAWQPDEIVLWGVWGNRPDHTLANLLMLTRPALTTCCARAYLSGWWAQTATPGRPAVLQVPAGSLVSLIPLSATVSGIVTGGLRYPLPAPWEKRGATLHRGSGRGISNIVLSQPATVHIGRGLLLLLYGQPSDAAAELLNSGGLP
jgi:thiamine pyrophosphokinase